MELQVKPSNIGSDVRCAVCGQGFLLFSDKLAHLHHHAVVMHVQRALRQHHAICDDCRAHPAEGFSMLLLLELLCPAAA